MNTITDAAGASPTVHQLLGRLAPEYIERFGATMPARQRQVLRKILSCRTPALGGQLFTCPECPGFLYRYHSCNDRHCPQCGQADADQWLQRQGARLLLPVPYYLVTFTVPEELRAIIRSNLKSGLDLLFEASARALQDLAANPRRMGAKLGMLGVMHTWSRTLMFHPHVHYLLPAGGLSPDGRSWVSARDNYLLSHRALGDRCRTVFREKLLKDHPQLYQQVPAGVWKKHWNVGCQAAGSGENALKYLARYVFKTATSNRVVPICPDGRVRWNYRANKTGGDASVLLEPMEWMRRFLQHILPRGFARVRTFGWLHPAARLRGNRVRALLRVAPALTPAEQSAWNPPTATPTPVTTPDDTPAQKGTGAPHCPLCQRVMKLMGSWHAGQAPLHPKRPP